MANFDHRALDHYLQHQLQIQRNAAAELWRQPERAPGPEQLTSRLLSDRTLEQVQASEEPFVGNAYRWLLELRQQLEEWPLLRELSRRWRQPSRVAHLDTEASPRQLRARLLTCGDKPLRDQHAAGLARLLGELARVARDGLNQRWAERSERAASTPLQVANGAPDAAVKCARRLLERSEDMAEALLPRSGWSDTLASALGSDAEEGWPARLNNRWLVAFAAPAGLASGLRLSLGTLPQAWGASSFGRALGMLGEALLLAARPAALPFYAQLHPRGVRRHRRRALFSALVAEPSFAARTLGLGKDRRERHVRACSRAWLQTLRIEALRVLLVAALQRGSAEALEQHEALTRRVFGIPAPPALLGVLPALHHPASGAALLGMALAAPQHDRLVTHFDSDWFQNPRATEWLRVQDGCARSEQDITDEQLADAVERTVAQLESRLS